MTTLGLTGDLLRAVAKTQHDKTLIAVRDAMNDIPTTRKKANARWQDDHEPVPAKDYRRALVEALHALREDA